MKIKYLQIIIGMLLISCAGNRHVGPAWYSTEVESSRGQTLFMQGDFNGAIGAYVQALVEAQRNDIAEHIALYRFNIGRIYLERNIPDSAELFLNAAYKSFNQCDDRDDAGRTAGFLALAYCKQGKTDSAWAWYKRRAPEKKSADDKVFWLTVFGRITWQEKHENSALAYFEEALRNSKPMHRWHSEAMLDFYCACVYAYGGDYPEAKKLLLDGLASSDKAQERYDRYKILLRLAAICACQNNIAEAEQYYIRARATLPQGITLPDFESLKSCPKELFGE